MSKLSNPKYLTGPGGQVWRRVPKERSQASEATRQHVSGKAARRRRIRLSRERAAGKPVLK